MSIAKPFTFVANTYAKASEVNANFDTVYSQVNSNISAIAHNAVDIENLGNNKADINGNALQRFGVADAVTASDAINKQSLFKYIGNSIDYISGFTITKDSGSPDNTIIVSAGSCYDSGKTTVLSKNADTTKTNLNQGAIATYYVYIIGNASGASTDILISEANEEPGLPEGYTLYRQIGRYTTDSNSKISEIYYYGVNPDSDKSITGIINSCMPDYSRGVTKSWDTDYTTSNACYLTLTNLTARDDNAAAVLDITYRGTTKQFKIGHSTSASESAYFTATWLLPKDATYKFTGGSTRFIVEEFPFIGEV